MSQLCIHAFEMNLDGDDVTVRVGTIAADDDPRVLARPDAWQTTEIGGSQPVQTVTVPVASAEILALVETPKVLIPGVAGSMTIVIGSCVVYKAGLTPYTDHDGSILTVGTGVGAFPRWGQTPVSNFLTSADDEIAPFSPSNPGVDGAGIGPIGDFAGADITLSVSTTDPTDGDGTLLVTVYYFLAPTA